MTIVLHRRGSKAAKESERERERERNEKKRRVRDDIASMNCERLERTRIAD